MFCGRKTKLAWVLRSAFLRLSSICHLGQERPIGKADFPTRVHHLEALLKEIVLRYLLVIYKYI